jgi:hypothetical protein
MGRSSSVRLRLQLEADLRKIASRQGGKTSDLHEFASLPYMDLAAVAVQKAGRV